MRAVQSQPLSTIVRLTLIVASKHIFCTIYLAVLLFVKIVSVCAPTQQCFDVPTTTEGVSVHFTEPIGVESSLF